jgi:hypothetical protein
MQIIRKLHDLLLRIYNAIVGAVCDHAQPTTINMRRSTDWLERRSYLVLTESQHAISNATVCNTLVGMRYF